MSLDNFDRPERVEFDAEGYAVETLAVRAGQQRTPEGEHSDPIYPTSSFVFSTAREAAARFRGEEPGNIYSRFTNPTVRAFEQRLAAMEGAERAVGTSSGMGAITSLCMALLESGDQVICSRSVFGSTISLFNNFFAKMGIETVYVNPVDLDDWKNAMTDRTKLLFMETPSNPLMELTDIEAVAAIAHEHGALLVVDNCFMSPALQNPIKLGADIVVHSATKYIDGQGRCIGGAVVGRETEMAEVFRFLRTGGTTMSPFNAWVFLKGLETLPLRMKAHSENAMEIAKWLEQQPQISRVFYSGLESHSQHKLACKQQKDFGGVLSFEVNGDMDAAWRFIDATKMVSITGNLGDVKSTITHPATTTHGRMTPEARAAAGIHDNLIRFSAGLESLEDLKADLALGLAAI